MGRSGGNNNDWRWVLPVAEGMLTSHTPVAADEVTRVPKMRRTYLLASARAYILDETRLNGNDHHMDGHDYLTSLSRTHGRMQRGRQNNTPPTLQCDYTWIPIWRLNVLNPQLLTSSQTHTCATKCQIEFQDGKRKILTSWV